jgi:ubiquitin C-terminal hydrolase
VFVNTFPFFDSHDPQDSSEFLTLLLDALHEETRATSAPLPPPFSTEGNVVDHADLGESIEGTIAAHGSSVFSDLFRGVSLVTTSSVACVHGSAKTEPFFVLSVPVVTMEGDLIGNLFESISELQRPQRLVAENRWFCEACGAKVEAETRTEIVRLPRVLILSFKRFRFNRGHMEKLSHTVTYPEHLELKSQNFQLFGVVLHSGGAGGGHYCALVRRDNRWFRLNDSHVSPTHEQVLNLSDAYILFYRTV